MLKLPAAQDLQAKIAQVEGENASSAIRAIDQAELGWQETLNGIPKEIYQFWDRQLKAGGYHLKYEVIDRPAACGATSTYS